jgi:hypothetical protein
MKLSELPELSLSDYALIEKQVRADMMAAAVEAAKGVGLLPVQYAEFVRSSVGTYVTPAQVEVFLQSSAGALFALNLAAKRAGVSIEEEVAGASILDLWDQAFRVTFRRGVAGKPDGAD